MPPRAHRHRETHGAETSVGPTPPIAVVVAPAVAAVAALLIPGTLGTAISALAAGSDSVPALLRLVTLLTVAVGGNAVGTLVTGAYIAARTATLRTSVAGAAVSAPGGHGAADLVTRLLVDARQPAVLLPLIASIALAAVSALGGLVLLAGVDWILLVGVLIGLLVVLVLVRNLVGDLTPLFQNYRRAQSEVGQRLLDAQAGATTIRAAGTWRREATRVRAAVPAVRAAGDALWSAQRGFAWKTSIFVPAMLLVTVAVGGWSMAVGRIDTGGFAAAIGYALVILGALDGIEAAAGLGAVRAGQARLAALENVSRVSWPCSTPGTPIERLGPLDVALDDVAVTLGGRTVLEGVDLRVPAGAFVALTGAPGSGRSTLARVIAGLAAPDHGLVRIGGRTVDAWRTSGAVPAVYGQGSPALLNETIAGAIGLAADTGPQTVRDAARQAHLVDVIDALPNGFDTPLCDLELSGGELQRLAIAQALARPSSVLVLDDVTASLDPATEREVLGALLAARTDRTLVVVTNRAAVIESADLVVHLEDGRVAVPAGSGATR